VLPIFYGN